MFKKILLLFLLFPHSQFRIYCEKVVHLIATAQFHTSEIGFTSYFTVEKLFYVRDSTFQFLTLNGHVYMHTISRLLGLSRLGADLGQTCLHDNMPTAIPRSHSCLHDMNLSAADSKKSKFSLPLRCLVISSLSDDKLPSIQTCKLPPFCTMFFKEQQPFTFPMCTCAQEHAPAVPGVRCIHVPILQLIQA